MTLMAPLPWQLLAGVFIAATGFGLLIDRIKLLVTTVIRVE
jgi:hypothetical protein